LPFFSQLITQLRPRRLRTATTGSLLNCHPKEFGLLQAELVSRIRREEELLYPLHEQISAKKAA
jgi:hypothetical protein